MMQFIDDWMTCAGISAQTSYEEAVIGTPGPDGEDPLRSWKPIGLLATLDGQGKTEGTIDGAEDV